MAAAARLHQFEAAERGVLQQNNSATPYIMATNLRAAAAQARADLNSAINDIRTIPGYEGFLALSDWVDVATAVQFDRPLVYLLTTPAGSLALIVHRSNAINEPELTPVWLDEFIEPELHTILIGRRIAYSTFALDFSTFSSFGRHTNQTAMSAMAKPNTCDFSILRLHWKSQLSCDNTVRSRFGVSLHPTYGSAACVSAPGSPRGAGAGRATARSHPWCRTVRDIAGFNPLTEALDCVLGSRQGAEALTYQFNQFYDALMPRSIVVAVV